MKTRVLIFLAATALPSLAPGPAAADFRSASFAVRSGYDVGSVAVPGTDDGLGLGGSLRIALGDTGGAWELGAEADIAGYSGSADGDPILHLAFMASRRWDFGAPGDSSRAYGCIGAGIGLQGLATGGTVFPLRAALGIALFARSTVGLELALYERVAPVHGDGDPAWEFVNSVGVELALRFGR
jgi:hypothetical protein